jgi:hypothetical protein
MEYKVLIISGYFFIAYIVMIIDYILRDSKYEDDEVDRRTDSLLHGLLWILLPVLFTFKFIDKYLRN